MSIQSNIWVFNRIASPILLSIYKICIIEMDKIFINYRKITSICGIMVEGTCSKVTIVCLSVYLPLLAGYIQRLD